MRVVVQGQEFIISDELLPKGSYLKTLLETEVGSDRTMDGSYILDEIDIKDFEQYYKYLNFETMFDLDEVFFDYMGHPNTLHYPLDFWKVKLIDDRIREMWYNINEPGLDLIEIEGPIDPIRLREVLTKLGTTLPPKHVIAGGAVLYLAGITNTFKDIDIFTCDKEETMRHIETIYGQRDYYGLYQSGNAITYKGNVNVQYILREYTSPSQIIHGFDVSCCSILFDGEKLWTTNKGLYCINNMVNWFEPDRSSPTYAMRLSKYHIRGFMLRFPSIEGIIINDQYYAQIYNTVLYEYYHNYDNIVLEKVWNPYIDVETMKKDYVPYYVRVFNLPRSYATKLNGLLGHVKRSLAPSDIINSLYNRQGDRYEDIISDLYKNIKTVQYSDIIRIMDEEHYDDYGFDNYINAFTRIHLSTDPLANPVASAMSYLREINYDFLWPKDPMSIMISTSVLGIHPRNIIGKVISDYEAGKLVKITDIKDIKWYNGSNPMNQDLTGTFYPEPIVEDVRTFYLSSPILMEGIGTIEPRRWYRKNAFK